MKNLNGSYKDYVFYNPELLYDSSLSAAARLICGIIFTESVETGSSVISDKELAEKLGRTSARTIAKSIDALVEKGYLTQEGVGKCRRLMPNQELLDNLRDYVAKEFGRDECGAS